MFNIECSYGHKTNDVSQWGKQCVYCILSREFHDLDLQVEFQDWVQES